MGRAALLCDAGPCVLEVKLEHPGGTVCATCHPLMSLCQAPARVELWQLCLISPSPEGQCAGQWEGRRGYNK